MSAANETIGNGAAMREALEKLRAEIGRFYANEWIPYDAWQGCDEIISNALSAPPRNCDRFIDAAKAQAAYDEYRRDFIMRSSNPFDKPMPILYWLFAECRRGEGGVRRCPNKGYWCMKRRCWCEGECDLTAGKTADKTENKTQQGETR